MGIISITHTHHQPGAALRVLPGPIEPFAGSTHNSNISGYVHAMHSCDSKKSTEIANGGQVLVAGAANQLDPRTIRQSQFTGIRSLKSGLHSEIQLLKSSFMGCQRRLLAPPISTTTFKRGSRRQRSHKADNSERDNT
jgi:hypothetical protein